MEINIRNQMMYLAMWQMINKMVVEGTITPEILEILNRKNAETLMCDMLPIVKIA